MGTYANLLHGRQKPELKTAPSASVEIPHQQLGHASNIANKHDSNQASLPMTSEKGVPTSLLSEITAVLDQKATTPCTFRFPNELIDRLDEVHFQLRKHSKSKQRLAKNDVIIAALIYVLLDFEKEGEQSLLSQLFPQV